MNLYVANLSTSVNDEDLKSLFSGYGNVVSAKVIVDKFSGRSRGFGFVEMNTDSAQKAIDNLNGKIQDGKSMSVSEARQKRS